jgi:hypothetical protein
VFRVSLLNLLASPGKTHNLHVVSPAVKLSKPIFILQQIVHLNNSEYLYPLHDSCNDSDVIIKQP